MAITTQRFKINSDAGRAKLCTQHEEVAMSSISPNDIADALSDADFLERQFVQTGDYRDWAEAALAWLRYDRAWAQYDYERRRA